MNKILLLFSNANSTGSNSTVANTTDPNAHTTHASHLAIDEEVRDIRITLERSQHRDQFDLEPRGAVRPKDLQKALLDVAPRIVHFSGHGNSEDQIILEDDTGAPLPISGPALADLFKIFANQVECIILNACYSETQADALTQHINYVIGMSQEIPDSVAIDFSIGFYRGLGAGRSIEDAFALGCNEIQLQSKGSSTAASSTAEEEQSRFLFEPEDDSPQVVLDPPLADHLIPVLKKKQSLTPIKDTIPTQTQPPLPPKTVLLGHSDIIRSIAFSPDGHTLLSGSDDRTVRLWDIPLGNPLHVLTGHSDRITCIGMSPDGQTFLSGSPDGTIKGWNIAQLSSSTTKDCLYTVSGLPLTLENSLPIGLNPSQPYFMTGAPLGTVSLWNLQNGQPISTIRAYIDLYRVLAVAMGPHNNIIATSCQNSPLAQSMEQGNVIGKALSSIGSSWLESSQQKAVKKNKGPNMPDIDFAKIATEPSTIKIWDIKTWEEGNSSAQPLKIFADAHIGRIFSLAIDPTGQTLVSAGADRTLKIWSLKDEGTQPKHTLKGHSGQIRCVTIGPDGTKIASASDDYTVKIWDLATGSLLLTLTGHLGAVRTVAFSPNGNLLASAGDDLEIRLWQL